MIDLILKDIDDIHIRENFFRLKNFLNGQVLFDGDFKLFDVKIDKKETSFKLPHGLTFIPADIISLSASGNMNYFFRFQEFTKTDMFITTEGPVRLRFLAGKLRDPTTSRAAAAFPIVSLGDTLPASPGFIFSAIDTKSVGFWLTSEQIPTNVVGIPVVFSDAVILRVAIGTQVESNYTIGIYQHEGNSLNLLQLGQFDVTSGGPKRIDLNFPIVYSSPNVQLACRILSGTTNNLKATLVLKGSTV